MINYHRIIYFLLTQKCFSCGKKINYNDQTYLLCSNCLTLITPIRFINYTKCIKCSSNLYYAKENNICYNCSINDFVFRKNTSLFYYNNIIIKELVHKFKFESNKSAGKDIASIINPEIKFFLSNNNYDVITIVPLSKKSLKKRGFNQVEFILNECKIKYLNILSREEHKLHQSQLSEIERKELIKGQFRIKENYKEIISGKNILVIDDIYTTGSTSNEISRILLESNANSVDILTFFRD